MWLLKFNIVGFLLLFVGQYNTFALQDLTADLFGGENYGTVAAFGDIYADKQTDIFIIRQRMLILLCPVSLLNVALFKCSLFKFWSPDN